MLILKMSTVTTIAGKTNNHLIMKKLFNISISFAVAAMALVACTKDLEQVVDEEPIAVGSHITFYAEPGDPATRVTLTPTTSEEKAFKGDWEATDRIELHAVSPNSFDETGVATWNLSDDCFKADFETTAPTTPGAWTYTAKYPYTENGNIPFGTDRVQNGNAYNSAYDVMYGTRSYDNAKLGKDNNGNPFILPMQRLTCIAYFHITGGPNEPVVSATLQATGIAAENITIASDGSAVTRVNNSSLDAITITFADGTAPTANDLQLWFNVMPGTYPGLTLTIVTTNHTTVLHNNKTLTYTAGKLNRAKLNGGSLTWAGNVFFEERFYEANGTGGWSGNIAFADFISDNDGWDATAPYSSYKAARFGSSKNNGNATTPSITIPSLFWDKTLHFSFKAGAWAGKSTTLVLSVDGATLSENSVTLLDSEWQVYDLTITNVTKSPITISFTKSDQWFLDDVLVYYGTRPIASQLLVTPTEERTVGYLAGSLEYAVSYTVDEVESSAWNVTTSSDGFSVAKNTDGTGFTVSYTQNDGTARTGVITVTAGDKSATVTILQSEKSWIDILNRKLTEVTGTFYTDWSGVRSNTTAIYAGNSAGDNNSIQLRKSSGTQAPSGIITTSSGGYATKVTVTWNSNTANNRKLNVYGKSTAYSSVSDLYGDNAGILLGEIVCGTSTELSIPYDCQYIGLCSDDGAMYLEEIRIEWSETGSGTPIPTPEITVATVAATSTATSAGTTATLNGTITLVNGAVIGNVTEAGFYYKLTSAEDYTKATCTSVSSTSFSYDLTGLTKDSEYTFYAYAKYDNGSDVSGETATFTPTQTNGGTLTLDFENTASSYSSDWTITTITTQKNTITAHGGSYYGNTDGKTSGSIQTANIVANPGTLTFYISKESNNTKASSWLVKVSSDGSSWTQVGDSQSASSGITNGTWTEVTRDLTSYSNVYIKIEYDGTAAIRCIDDISLTYN